MFVYYFVLIQLPFEVVESRILEAVDHLGGWAEKAYRHGEALGATIRVGSEGPRFSVAKKVRIEIRPPRRDGSETAIPITWEATGTPGLFPRLDADIVVATLSDRLSQVSLRGNYRPPLGAAGRVLDRLMLHRVAETSVKRFLDQIAERVGPIAPAGAGD